MDDSEQTQTDDVFKFIAQDNINPAKYSANAEILKNGSIEIYKATSKLHNITDISADSTKSINWMASPLNQPIGIRKWFMVAYPDVVKWFSELEENKMLSILGNNLEDVVDDEKYIKLPFLRKVVDEYKKNAILECSIK